MNHFFAGAGYFFKGVRLLMRPELRRYILVPLAINCVIFFSLTYWFIAYFDSLLQWQWNLPAWLEFIEKTLKFLAWIVLGIILVITYGYLFNVITNIIAAPFYGLLAQRTEELLTGVKLADEPLLRMTFRTLFRELQKLVYFIGRGILVMLLIVLLGTLFILGAFAPIVGGLWSAWSMSIQYVDYPADNHQTPFRRLRKKLRKQVYSSLGFGASVMAASVVPVVNIIAMPAAVIGGTLFWVNELKDSEQTTPKALKRSS